MTAAGAAFGTGIHVAGRFFPGCGCSAHCDLEWERVSRDHTAAIAARDTRTAQEKKDSRDAGFKNLFGAKSAAAKPKCKGAAASAVKASTK